MYGEEVPISNENVFTLLSAAKQLEIFELEGLCVSHIRPLFTVENVCHVMNEAVRFNSALLQENCKAFLSKQTKQVFDSVTYYSLTQPALSAVLGVQETNIVEILLFHNIKRWMKQKFRKQNLAEMVST